MEYEARILRHYLLEFAERLKLGGLDSVREEIDALAAGLEAEHQRHAVRIAALEQRCADLSARIASMEAYHN